VGFGCAVHAAEGDAPATTWAFTPTRTDSSLLDLRYLNEPIAGQSGFVRRSASGDAFVLGDGSPVRFWGINSNVTRFSDAELDLHARWLASLGVNMVRISGATIQSKRPLSQVTDPAEDSLRNIWRATAAMKKQGIYVTLHHYWAKGSGADVTRWGIDGYTGKSELWGLLFFNPELQRGYRAWLEQQYGSLDTALQRWDGATVEGDRPNEGILALLGIDQALSPQGGGRGRRIADQYRFFVETMRRFNAETARHLREELGCRQLICAGNWRTANDTLMLDAERYASTVNDVIAKNHYFNGVHEGPTRTYAVSPGDLTADRSALLEPQALPLNMKHVAGYPSVITESTWTHPNRYQSEAPFLAAVYGSLGGLDGFYWFGTGEPEYEPPVADEGLADLVRGVPSPKEPVRRMGKFQVAQPMIAGLFPATALIYRKGYVRPSPTVIHEERLLADLWDRKLPLICEDQAFDPNRDAQQKEAGEPEDRTNPLAFLAGRVEVVYGGNPSKTRVEELTSYVDTDSKMVRSMRDEIVLDYGIGICRLDAPKAQGVCGFLQRAGKIALSSTEIESDDPYASVLVVAMDDLPLTESRQVLVQVGTTARPSGWRTEPAEVTPKNWKNAVPGERILDVGHGPWLVASAHVTHSLANPQLTSAMLLDASGEAVRSLPIDRNRVHCRIVLPPETMHVVLTAGEGE
jgi:hypothetical protein